MQVGHKNNHQDSDYELVVKEESKIDDIISNAEFPDDYDAFCDENLDMIP